MDAAKALPEFGQPTSRAPGQGSDEIIYSLSALGEDEERHTQHRASANQSQLSAVALGQSPQMPGDDALTPVDLSQKLLAVG